MQQFRNTYLLGKYYFITSQMLSFIQLNISKMEVLLWVKKASINSLTNHLKGQG